MQSLGTIAQDKEIVSSSGWTENKIGFGSSHATLTCTTRLLGVRALAEIPLRTYSVKNLTALTG